MAFSGQPGLGGSQATPSWFVVSIRPSFKLPETYPGHHLLPKVVLYNAKGSILIVAAQKGA